MKIEESTCERLALGTNLLHVKNLSRPTKAKNAPEKGRFTLLLRVRWDYSYAHTCAHVLMNLRFRTSSPSFSSQLNSISLYKEGK